MKIALIGVSGNFFDIFEELQAKGYDIIGYINKASDSRTNLRFLGNDSTALPDDVFKIITVGGIGRNIGLRKKLYEIHKERLINLFFEGSKVSNYVSFRENSGIIVFRHVVIKAKCTLGENVFVNSGSVIGHDVNIGSHTHISLGVLIGGGTVIGEDCYVGMGAKIFENVKIGRNCIISAGAMITKDVPADSFVVEKDRIRKINRIQEAT